MTTNPFFDAWEKIRGARPRSDVNPVILAKALIHDGCFTPKRIGEELFLRCLKEIEDGGTDIYPAEIVEAACIMTPET